MNKLFTVSNKMCTINNVALLDAKPPVNAPTFMIKFWNGERINYPFNDDNNFYECVSEEDNLWRVTSLYDPDVFYGFGLFNAPKIEAVCAVNNMEGVTSVNDMFYQADKMTACVDLNLPDAIECQTMFCYCSALSSFPSVYAPKAEVYLDAFNNCSEMTAIPNITVSNVNWADYMFLGCVNVQSGIYDMYTQLSAALPENRNHYATFRDCGINTVQGAAELAQIPDDWK